MTGQSSAARRAFSLVELVIVVVIIGIIAAIAAPRFSSAISSAVGTSVESNIATVTRAMAIYEAEHGKYPGYNPSSGSPENAMFPRQLMEFSDQNGNVSTTYGSPYIFGPYLRPPFPTNPLNDLDTVRVILTPTSPVIAGSSGWVAVLSTGEFGINATAADLAEIPMKDAGGAAMIK